jgi:hypothetical protein
MDASRGERITVALWWTEDRLATLKAAYESGGIVAALAAFPEKSDKALYQQAGLHGYRSPNRGGWHSKQTPPREGDARCGPRLPVAPTPGSTDTIFVLGVSVCTRCRSRDLRVIDGVRRCGHCNREAPCAA